MRKSLFLYVIGFGTALMGSGIFFAIKMGESAVSLFHSAAAPLNTLTAKDRHGTPLSYAYKDQWNGGDTLPLHKIPPLLKTAFIMSEDHRFFSHSGVDIRAKMSALKQNVTQGRIVRGGSTLTEQVVRLLMPRPRRLWAKGIEALQAVYLSHRIPKWQLLEFYLNQVPFASNRRGVLQAARAYFNRDLSTLTPQELLALVILVRAPSAFDLFKNKTSSDSFQKRLMVLAHTLYKNGHLSTNDFETIRTSNLALEKPAPLLDVSHFVRYVRRQLPSSSQKNQSELRTTLDAPLQQHCQLLLDNRLAALTSKSVSNGAVLVANHQTGEILAWVVGGDKQSPTYHIDSVTAYRQPGSALKPFLYAQALEKGWTPITFIEDCPLSEGVGKGLHRFKNYSNRYYGLITVREALANSLNIPAIRTILYVGVHSFLEKLHQLGFVGLKKNANIYDEGLALGNGETTLFQLVQAYAVLANKGVFQPLKVLDQQDFAAPVPPLFSKEVTSLVGNILSDPWARRLEFGHSSVMNLTTQTAIKTGTSTNYRDAVIIGYNHRYVVGIWMGNLTYKPMNGITGSTGPALLLRNIFSRLTANEHKTAPLYLSPKLKAQDVCVPTPMQNHCAVRTDYFMNGTHAPYQVNRPEPTIVLKKPTPNLQLAIDPRIPLSFQKFNFEIDGTQSGDTVHWFLNHKLIAQTPGPTHQWPLQEGAHKLEVTVLKSDGSKFTLPSLSFYVRGIIK